MTSNTLSESIPLLSIQTASLAPCMDPACLVAVTLHGCRGYIHDDACVIWEGLGPFVASSTEITRAAPHFSDSLTSPPLRQLRGLRDVALCMNTACETYLRMFCKASIGASDGNTTPRGVSTVDAPKRRGDDTNRTDDVEIGGFVVTGRRRRSRHILHASIQAALPQVDLMLARARALA